MRFMCLRTELVLCIQIDPKGVLTIKCEDLDLCATLVQAMAEFFALEHLKSVAEFPKEVANLIDCVQKVSDMHLVGDQLTADVADLTQLIKGLLIRAEDCRIMKDM